MFDKRIIITAGVSLFCIGLALYWALTPTTTPWTETGRLVLLVRPTPGVPEDIVLGLGVDDIELYGAEGEITRVTVRNRRVQLRPGSNELSLVLDTTVPTGTYSGFGFKIKSPEMRNAWQQDIAPEYVTMLSDSVALEVPYQIEEDVTSAIVLAFETTRAIYEKEDQRFYLPIIQIETRRNATVDSTQEKVTVSGGTIEHSATFGMDWNGNMRFNYREKPYIPQEQNNTYTPVQPETQEATTTQTQATSTATSTEVHATSTEQKATTTEDATKQSTSTATD